MINLSQAKQALKETFDSAFSKSSGTRKQRISMAHVCCRKVPTNSADSLALQIWAVEYCAKWKPAQ